MIVFDHSVPAVWIVLLVAAALVLGGFTFWRWVPRRLINGVLPLLYLLTILLFVWCLLMPGSRDSVTRLLKPRFIVMLDTSASMALTPSEDVPSRWTVAREVLGQSWTSLVGSECEIDVYPLAATVGDRLPLADAVDLQTEGESTLLREALDQISERSAGLNVAGALLLSDGMDTREAFDDWAAESRPFPIHTVRLQPDAAWQAEPDLRIDGVQTPRRVTVDWTTDMKILVAGQGTGGKGYCCCHQAGLFQEGATFDSTH